MGHQRNLDVPKRIPASFDGVSRPNNTGQSAHLDGAAQPRLTQWFNTSVCTAPVASTFGNVGRNLPDVRTHGISNQDFTIFKNTAINERFSACAICIEIEFLGGLSRVCRLNFECAKGNGYLGRNSADSSGWRLRLAFAARSGREAVYRSTCFRVRESSNVRRLPPGDRPNVSPDGNGPVILSATRRSPCRRLERQEHCGSSGVWPFVHDV